MDDMELDKRLKRIEQRMDRDYKHLERVILTNRDVVQKAFDQMHVALLEHQLSLTRDVGELGGLMRSTNARLDAFEKRLDRLETRP